jgi:hypothetical protein
LPLTSPKPANANAAGCAESSTGFAASTIPGVRGATARASRPPLTSASFAARSSGITGLCKLTRKALNEKRKATTSCPVAARMPA